MPKTIKEFQLNQSTGEVSVEYSDDSTSKFNAADMVTAQTDPVTGGIVFYSGGERFYTPIYPAMTGNGVADDAAALQAAIDKAADMGGGTVVVPPGVWHWKSVPKLPAGIAGKMRILAYGAKIVLSQTGNRLLDLDRTDDNQTFKNFYVAGFEVDAAAIDGTGGTHHVLIGSLRQAGQSARFNAENWLFKDISIRNIPQHAGIGSQYNGVVILTVFHSSNDEATQNHLTDITFDNVIACGGDGGFQINAFCGGVESANVYLDNINISRCAHLLNTPAPRNFACSNIHIGGYGFGDRCSVVGFKGSGSGDNGIEINSMMSAFVDDIYLDGFWIYGLYAYNFRPPANVDSQQLICGKSSYELTATTGRAFSVGSDAAQNNPYGHIDLGQMSVYAPDWSASASAVNLVPNGAGTKDVRSFKLSSLTFTANMAGRTVQEGYYPSVIGVKFANERPVQIGTVSVDIFGTPASIGANNIYPRIFEWLGNARISIGAADVKCSVNFPNLWVNYIDDSIGHTDVIAERQNYAASGSVISWRVNGTPLDANHCISVSSSRLTGTDFWFSDAAQGMFVRVANTKLGTVPSVYTQAAGTSPWIWKNTSWQRQLLTLTYGNVSSVEISTDGGTQWAQIATGNTVVSVEPQQKIRVTHSSAPTVRTVPV